MSPETRAEFLRAISHSWNEGTPSWIVTEPEATECYLRVSDAANMKFCGETKEPFSIRPSIAVTYPNGGEQLKVGTTANLAWSSGGNVPTCRR